MGRVAHLHSRSASRNSRCDFLPAGSQVAGLAFVVNYDNL